MEQKKLLTIYSIIFTIFWIALAINPKYRMMWAVENTLLIIFIIVMIFIHKHLKLSNLSYTLILAFCALQTIGAHYTYAEVPMGFLSTLFGWERNNFDRIVHFSFGFLLAIPFAEFYKNTSHSKSKFWFFIIPILIAFATGAVYEVIEWAFAQYSGPNLAGQFLGSQGDIWDAQKDMFLAGLGATITMTVYTIIQKIVKK